MGKRKAKAAGQRPGKTRVELRLDDSVFESIKALADGAEITVNQLINGLARWAGQSGHLGEPKFNQDGVLGSTEMAGVIWFGQRGCYNSKEDMDRYEAAFDEPMPPTDSGQHYFTLDFTERRVIREEV